MDLIDSYKEAINSAHDGYMSTVSMKMGEVMKILSIIATIALPLTVISGIYGTNFVRLPGAGNPYGFWVMVLVMLGMVILALILFRRNKWI